MNLLVKKESSVIRKFICKSFKKLLILQLAEGYDVQNLTFSPITGGEGNIEFLIHLKWRVKDESEQGKNFLNIKVNDVVQSAHEQLKEGKIQGSVN